MYKLGGLDMKSSRFSQEQIIGILKQREAGVKASDLYRQHGIFDQTPPKNTCTVIPDLNTLAEVIVD